MLRKMEYNSIDELPITLTGEDVATVLSISRAGAYNLMKSKGFPALRVGKRIVVTKASFIQWVEKNTNS